SYAMFVLGRDISMAGNGSASSAAVLIQCPFDPANVGQSASPVPVVIKTGGAPNVPDSVTVFYGGSSTLSTPARFLSPGSATTPYQVPGPVAFSEHDVIAAVDGPLCTLSTIDTG